MHLRPTPRHRRGVVVAAVAAGGAMGAVLRALVVAALGAGVSLVLVNVLGALVAGWWTGRRRRCGSGEVAHAFVLTGLLGGFTTVSAWVLAVGAGAQVGVSARLIALVAALPVTVVIAARLGEHWGSGRAVSA